MPTSSNSGEKPAGISTKLLILILVLVLVLALVSAWAVYRYRAGGSQVLVTVNGRFYGSYSLRVNRTVVIESDDGYWSNTLRIEGGKAWISEANCLSQICVHTPALTEDYFGIIVCLPHGLVVELTDP